MRDRTMSMLRRHSTIIIIGPPEAGKTTVGKLLAEQLQIEQVSLDYVRFGYYEEIGYDKNLEQRLRATDLESLISYWQKFDVYAIERVLAEYSNCVIDFGAIHSVYDSIDSFKRVEALLKPHPNLVLLLPTSDKAENVEILLERRRQKYGLSPEELPVWRRVIHRFVYSPMNYELAKQVVHTVGRSPRETADDILALLEL